MSNVFCPECKLGDVNHLGWDVSTVSGIIFYDRWEDVLRELQDGGVLMDAAYVCLNCYEQFDWDEELG